MSQPELFVSLKLVSLPGHAFILLIIRRMFVLRCFPFTAEAEHLGVKESWNTSLYLTRYLFLHHSASWSDQ